jgi:DNA-binding transcriptional ArsR family regulator
MVDNIRRLVILNQMVEHDSHALDTIFHALGDATRRTMLGDLAAGERTVGELAQPFAMSLAAASKHIKVLEAAGLIRRDIRGRTHVCSLDPAPLMSADEWLGVYRRFWTDRLDTLEQLLRAEDAAPPPPKPPLPRKEGDGMNDW